MSKCWNLDKGGWLVLYIPTHPSISPTLAPTTHSFAHTHRSKGSKVSLFLSLFPILLYLWTDTRKSNIRQSKAPRNKMVESVMWQLCLLASRDYQRRRVRSSFGPITREKSKRQNRGLPSRKRGQRFAIVTFAFFCHYVMSNLENQSSLTLSSLTPFYTKMRFLQIKTNICQWRARPCPKCESRTVPFCLARKKFRFQRSSSKKGTFGLPFSAFMCELLLRFLTCQISSSIDLFMLDGNVMTLSKEKKLNKFKSAQSLMFISKSSMCVCADTN